MVCPAMMIIYQQKIFLKQVTKLLFCIYNYAREENWIRSNLMEAAPRLYLK